MQPHTHRKKPQLTIQNIQWTLNAEPKNYIEIDVKVIDHL